MSYIKMYKLAIILALVMFVSAKTIFLENDFEDILPLGKPNHDNIWVLNFNDDFDINPLRQPNKAELRLFKNSVAPVIKRNQRIKNENTVDFNDSEKFKITHVTKDKNATVTNQIKSELKEIINKFLHSIAMVDPSQSISSKKDKKTSLKIYFKGDSCAVVLESGRFRNVYFNDAEYGLLPRWFFEEHDDIEHDLKGNFVPIPEEVKTEFYEDILHLARTLYGYGI